jgi:hypothetical protein
MKNFDDLVSELKNIAHAVEQPTEQVKAPDYVLRAELRKDFFGGLEQYTKDLVNSSKSWVDSPHMLNYVWSKQFSYYVSAMPYETDSTVASLLVEEAKNAGYSAKIDVSCGGSNYDGDGIAGSSWSSSYVRVDMLPIMKALYPCTVTKENESNKHE